MIKLFNKIYKIVTSKPWNKISIGMTLILMLFSITDKNFSASCAWFCVFITQIKFYIDGEIKK